MQGAFATELDGGSPAQGKSVERLSGGVWFPLQERIEERGRDGEHEFAVPLGVLMVGVAHVAVGPFALSVVYGTQHIHAGHLPAVDVEVHPFHKAIVAEIVVAARIVVHHHRYLAVPSAFVDEGEHVPMKLVEDCLLVLGPMDSLIAQAQSYDDISPEVVYQFVVAME